MMSCKASIKANQYLTNDQIFALLEELRTTTNPYTCPHGRPILVHHSTYELEKMFKEGYVGILFIEKWSLVF